MQGFDNIIEIKGLIKEYPGFTLGPYDLSVPAGCITGFIGENGAGKSTTINAMLGLIKKDAGSIRLFGREDYLNDADVFDDIGVVLDSCGLHEAFTASQSQKILRGMYKRWSDDSFEDYLRRFRIDPKKKIKDYSQGMRRKLDLAIALSHDAKLLILDEPTSGLDPVVRDELLDVFLEFIQRDDRAIFLSSHILSDLEKASDTVAFLHGGKLIFHEPKDTLKERFLVVKCGEDDLKSFPKSAVRGVRKNRFGVEALVERTAVPAGYTVDRASIEDIMLFYVKEEMQ
ncbi:ABC transporter ATP-binding protein [Christensenellaceae bacterium OttesenSCG-928-M15]|nr:ABC transporter ATP-binding protein [Christensenellaceae bacterium OttesenSCG-928-M15]